MCCYKKTTPRVLYHGKNDAAANNLHDGKFELKKSCHEFSPMVLHMRWLKKRRNVTHK
jgi:hypothetical protein